MRHSCNFASAVIITLLFSLLPGAAYAGLWERFKWEEVNSGSGTHWEPRAGLQAVKKGRSFYVLGGRSPKMTPLAFGDSDFYNDVWRSRDQGETWERVSGGNGAPWPARAYFQAVAKGRYLYVIGGQDSKAIPNPDPTCGGNLPPGVPCPPFILQSTFFNDVWRSRDGVHWEQMTANAPWEGRAGLSAVVLNGWIYVTGGSFNDDSSIVGPGGPARIYFNDVYKSRDGKHWIRVTENAPWAPRAGAVLVRRAGQMYLLGGEDGFTCTPQTQRCPPYFNDVWRSRDGRHWKQLTASAGWSPRPGHQCEVLLGTFICFGGFGLSEDPTQPFKPSNPMDLWVSRNGIQWREVGGTASPPWNAAGPEEIRYDFAAFPVYFKDGKFKPSIYTFGGDLETFAPFDPLAFTKVSNAVWRFGY
jgi:hypothetical protein